jgi:RNA polymerase sigma-70 factor (family 1)
LEDIKREHERELFRRISEGEEPAFRLIFEAYTPKLLHYCRGMVKSESLAEEIVQDVFLKLWAGRSKLSTVENPNNWLFIIARNRVLDHFRKAVRETRFQAQMYNSIEENRNVTEEQMDESQSRRLIAKALDQLSEQKQRIFKLSRYEGLSHEEIAKELGLSKNTIKNHLVVTLQHIRDWLGKHSDPVITLIILHFLSN